MNAKHIHILAIEDSVVDAQRLRGILSQTPRVPYELLHRRQLDEGLATLQDHACDVILLDLTLPDSRGLSTLDIVLRAAPQTPIIVLTHLDDELDAIEAVRRGAQDFLRKSQLDSAGVWRAIAYAMERKRTERALNESNAQRQILEAEVLKISTHEQQRISQDLHDSVGQQLTGLSYLAGSLAKRLAAHNQPEANDAQLIVEGIQTALTEVRNAIRGLAPVDVDSAGLMVALKRLVTATQDRVGVTCEFTCHHLVRVEDNATATQLYRIAQEALHNAVKHAKAQHVSVCLRSVDGNLILEVSDDGSGLNEAIHPGTGMGLHIMHYRARSIGATLDITSTEDQGTSVTCAVQQEFAHVHHDA